MEIFVISLLIVTLVSFVGGSASGINAFINQKSYMPMQICFAISIISLAPSILGLFIIAFGG